MKQTKTIDAVDRMSIGGISQPKNRELFAAVQRARRQQREPPNVIQRIRAWMTNRRTK